MWGDMGYGWGWGMGFGMISMVLFWVIVILGILEERENDAIRI